MNIIPSFTKKLEKLTSFFPQSIHLYRLYYRKMVQREINIGNICPNDSVLCIGGGAFPCTALEIARQTGAKVEVLDVDPIAVKLARKLVKGLNMENQITIRKGEGQNIDASSFSVVHIALQVKPKAKVLACISKTIPANARIIVRSYGHREDCGCLDCEYINQNHITVKGIILLTKKKRRKIDEADIPVFRGMHISNSSNVVG